MTSHQAIPSSTAVLGWFSDGTPWTMAWIMGLTAAGCLATSVIDTRLRRYHLATAAVAP